MSSMVFKYQIKSKDNKCLILNAQGDFQFENSTVQQFNVQPYKSNDGTGDEEKRDKGRAVILYVYKDQQKWVACCRGNFEIYAKAMELPTDIKGTSHEALFYMKELSTPSSYTFQSTLDKSRFLGFQLDDTNPSRHKLVLIQDKDEVDECGPLQVL